MLTRRLAAVAGALGLGTLLPLSGIAHATGLLPMGGTGICKPNGNGGITCFGVATTDPVLGSGGGAAAGAGISQAIRATNAGAARASGGSGGSAAGAAGGSPAAANNVNWGPFIPGLSTGPACPGAVTGTAPNLQGCGFGPAPPPPVPPAGAPAAPPPPPPSPPNPADVARAASAQLPLPKPGIGSAPCTDPGCMGAVGMPVWLWTTNSWAPVSSTASIGGVTVTATAHITDVDWTMGDGGSVHCTTPGIKYDVSMGFTQSPECGYVYQTHSRNEPGGKFTMTATAHYTVVWTGAYTDTITLPTTSTVDVAIGEYQSVITS